MITMVKILGGVVLGALAVSVYIGVSLYRAFNR